MNNKNNNSRKTGEHLMADCGGLPKCVTCGADEDSAFTAGEVCTYVIPADGDNVDGYDIIIRFPNKKLADDFCGQMSAGFGEEFCDFSFWRGKKGTTGTNTWDFEKVTSSAPATTPVYFVNKIFKNRDEVRMS